MMKKLIVFLIAVLFFTGCTKPYRKVTSITPTPKPTVTVSKDWTEYSSDVFKFMIPIPPMWEVKEPAENLKPYAGLIVFRPITTDHLVNSKDELGLVKISISDSKLSVNEYIKTNICDAYKNCTSPAEATEYVLSNEIKAKRVANTTSSSPLDIVVVKREGHGPTFGSYIYAFALDTGSTLESYATLSLDERKSLFEKMLQGLRFIE